MKIRSLLPLVALAASCSEPAEIEEARSAAVGTGQQVELLRGFRSADHWLSTSASEIQSAGRLEGKVGNCWTDASDPGRKPLFRAYNPWGTDHLYTTSAGELDNAVRNRYASEGTTCYLYATQVAGTQPLHRFYSPSGAEHLYSTDQGEINNLGRNGAWRYEGVAGYLVAPASTGPNPWTPPSPPATNPGPCNDAFEFCCPYQTVAGFYCNNNLTCSGGICVR